MHPTAQNNFPNPTALVLTLLVAAGAFGLLLAFVMDNVSIR